MLDSLGKSKKADPKYAYDTPVPYKSKNTKNMPSEVPNLLAIWLPKA